MGRRRLTKQELEDIQWMLNGKIPSRPAFEFFIEKRMIILLSEIAKYLGLNAFVIRRYAKAQSGRFEGMGITLIGNKFYVNSATFSRWALTHRPTRRRMMLHFIDNLESPPQDGHIKDLLQSGKHYLFDDLISAHLIPTPFSSDAGKETILEMAKHHRNPKEEMGLYMNTTFKDWIVDPMPFFYYIGHKYGLVD